MAMKSKYKKPWNTLVLIASILALHFLFQHKFIYRFRSSISADVHRPLAINYLDSKPYLHHPIIHEADLTPLPARDGLLLEPNGLYVPALFDCPMFNNDSIWGSTNYFHSVPSRWTACWTHYAAVKAALPLHIPQLPIIDEEYFEQIAVYDSVLRAKGKFIVIEMGARWGTWASRSVAMMRVRNPLPYEALVYESNPVHCKGIEDVMHVNNIEMKLRCHGVDAKSFVSWVTEQSHVDLLDSDVQGYERIFFTDPDVMTVINEKVKRIIIGTHNQTIHENTLRIFSRWKIQHAYTFSKNTACTNHMRKRTSTGDIDRSNLEIILRYGCYYNSSYGNIANWDGEIIADNPRFLSGKVLFD